MNIIAALISKKGYLLRYRNKYRVKYSYQRLVKNNLGVLGIDFPDEKNKPSISNQ